MIDIKLNFATNSIFFIKYPIKIETKVPVYFKTHETIMVNEAVNIYNILLNDFH
jgi:hypothetical protein